MEGYLNMVYFKPNRLLVYLSSLVINLINFE